MTHNYFIYDNNLAPVVGAIAKFKFCQKVTKRGPPPPHKRGPKKFL